MPDTARPTRYPLCWPPGWPRTKPADRKAAAFRSTRETSYGPRGDDLSMKDATERLERELRRLRAADWMLSTNVELKQDGLPYARRRRPEDPGTAVYFKLRGGAEQKVLACDRWNRVEDNIGAVAAHIQALRGMERWGVGTVEQAYAGYKALPEAAEKPWHDVLGIPPDAPLHTAQNAYRRLAKLHHPDTDTGDTARFQEINEAWRQCRNAHGNSNGPA